jgi:hypothetical protein
MYNKNYISKKSKHLIYSLKQMEYGIPNKQSQSYLTGLPVLPATCLTVSDVHACQVVAILQGIGIVEALFSSPIR